MSREKQIEKMAKAVCELYKDFGSCEACDAELDIDGEPCIHECFAKAFYNAGYRKASDVAEEIFAEIERSIFRLETPYQTLYCIDDGFIAELKKKYTDVAERREVSENNTVRCFHPSVTESQREAERRKGVENSPVDCSTPSVTDQKGEGK